MSYDVTECGTVVKIMFEGKKRFAVVKAKHSSLCATCSHNKMCKTDAGDRMIKVLDGCNVKKGDKVEFSVSSLSFFLSVNMFYLFPVFGLIIGYFIGIFFFDEMYGIFMAILAMLAVFFVQYPILKRWKGFFMPKIIKKL